MQASIQILNTYKVSIQDIESVDLSNLENLKKGIDLSKNTLAQLCSLAKIKNVFSTNQEEVSFFKYTKPYVSGRLKFFAQLQQYHIERPKADNQKQEKHLRQEIKKLENYKKKNLQFWKYVRRNQTILDEIYFLRRSNTFDFISDVSQYYFDPEFSTSHDNLVAHIVAYDLLINYYNQLLIKLAPCKTGAFVVNPNFTQENQLSWTASKTDLIELIYALHTSQCIENGKLEISRSIKICENLFNIKLGNPYKTFSEIKARRVDRTKFLDSLKFSLLTKIDLDDF